MRQRRPDGTVDLPLHVYRPEDMREFPKQALGFGRDARSSCLVRGAVSIAAARGS